MADPDTTPARAGALLEAQDRFIAAWGQMGSSWGISRTMAESTFGGGVKARAGTSITRCAWQVA